MTTGRHSHSGRGGDGERIDYNNLKNKPTSSGGNTTAIKFIRAASVGTGNQSFTGIGFTPSHYSITAWRDATGGECVSHAGIDINGVEGGVSIRPVSLGGQIESASTTSVLRVFYTNSGGGDTRASHVSFDTDGITVNFVASAEDIQFILTCYG